MVNLTNVQIMKNINIILLLLLVGGCSKSEDAATPQKTLLESRTEGQIMLSSSVAQVSAVTTRGALVETINYEYEVLHYTFAQEQSTEYKFAVRSGDNGKLMPFESGEYISTLNYAEEDGLVWRVAENTLSSKAEELPSGSKIFCFAGGDTSITTPNGESVSKEVTMPNTFSNSETSPLEGADFVDNLYLQGVYELEQVTTLSKLTESNIELSVIPALVGVRITNNSITGVSSLITSASISSDDAIFPSSATIDGESVVASTTNLYDKIEATISEGRVSIASGEYATLYFYLLPNPQIPISSDITISAQINGEDVELYTLTPQTLAAMNSLGQSCFESGEAYIFDTNIVGTPQISLGMSDEDIASAISTGTKFTFDIEAVNVAWETSMPDWLSISPSWCSTPLYDPVTVTVTIAAPDNGAASQSGALEFIDSTSGDVIHSISVSQPMTTIATNLLNLLGELNSGAESPVTLNWNSATQIADWEGVTLDEDGEVIELKLSDKGFEGIVPATYISKFTSLITLDLSHNSLGDGMLITYGNLKALEYLDVSHNQITKVNMQAFKSDETNTRSIKYLYLNDNVISSSTGGVNEIINIPTLVEFSMANNLMTATISENSGVAGPENLELFDISGNGFKGTLPWYLFNSPQLTTLKTSSNTSLSGVLTDALISQLGYSEAEIAEYITDDTSITREQ